jgi:hypothetical protein
MTHRAKVLAGVGGIAFGVLTVASFVPEQPPGGSYVASEVMNYVATNHYSAAVVSLFLQLLGLLGLICLLAYLREAISVTPGNQLAASVFWGAGLAAAASFAVGEGIDAAQPMVLGLAGSALSIAPATIYLIYIVGLDIILGPAAMLMGFALIALMLGSRAILPSWLRWLTLIFGVISLASVLIFIPLFVLLIWGVVIGVWLVVAGRGTTSSPVVAQPSV